MVSFFDNLSCRGLSHKVYRCVTWRCDAISFKACVPAAICNFCWMCITQFDHETFVLIYFIASLHFLFMYMQDIISLHKAMLSIFMCFCMIRCNMLSMFGLLSPAQWSSNGIAYICATSTSFGVGAVIAMVVAAHGCSSE